MVFYASFFYTVAMNKYYVYVDSPVTPSPYIVLANRYSKEFAKDSEWQYAWAFYREGEDLPVAAFPDVLAIIKADDK